MLWAADVSIAGPVGSMGQRVLQPIVNQQVEQVLAALEKQVHGCDRDRRSRRAGQRRRVLAAVAPPFRIGVMQLTMEPLDEMLETARALDRGGFDTIWLAEAYPWWRKHGMEARSSTVVSALMARDTERLTIGWGIISPYTRHPVQVAMDARVVQEAAGPGRFIVGFGTSKIFLNNTKQGGPPKETKPLGHMRDSVAIVRGVLGGERFEYDGKVFSADVPGAPGRGARAALGRAGLRRRRPRRRCSSSAARSATGCLTPSITTPAFVRYTRGNIAPGAAKAGRDPGDVDLGCTIVASIHATDRDAGPRRRARDRRHVPREQGPEHPGLGRHAARPGRDRDGRDRPGRRGDGARRPARREGAGHRLAARPLQADRRHARPTASRRSRSTARRAARTSCSSSGAPTGTSRSACSPSRSCPTFEDDARRSTSERLVDWASQAIDISELHRRRAGDGRADGRDVRRDGPAGAVAAGRGRAARTCSAPGPAPAAGRA